MNRTRFVARCIILAALTAAAASAPAPAANPPATQPDRDSVIAAEINRLADAAEAQNAAGAAALATIGAPAAPALLRALADPRNEFRARAAGVLHAIIAADATAALNCHDQTYWEKRIAKAAAGMSVDEALRVLLPHATNEERKASIQMGAWSGQSGFSTCRLDDYWTATFQLVNAGNERLSQMPTLARSVRSIWVQPPGKYTGNWVTWFVHGRKAHEILFRDGQYDGTFTAFRDDGTRIYEQHYRLGVCDGADTGWYSDGRKMYEGQYKDNKQDGRWQHWYPDGKPQSVREFREGDLDGVSTSWFQNGRKQSEQNYVGGKQDGLDTCWDEQGKLLWSRIFRGGKLIDPG